MPFLRNDTTFSGVDSECCTHYDYDVGTPTPHWGVGDIVIYAKQLKCFPWSATDLKTTAEKFLSLDLTLQSPRVTYIFALMEVEERNHMKVRIEKIKSIIVRWWICDIRYRSEFQRKPRKEITMETNSYYVVESDFGMLYRGPSLLKAIRVYLITNADLAPFETLEIYKVKGE